MEQPKSSDITTNSSEKSEFNTKPRHFLTHDPSLLTDLRGLTDATLRTHHFLQKVDAHKLQDEYDQFILVLRRAGVDTIELVNLLSGTTMQFLHANPEPNLMFTRDPAVTLPWLPDVFISANFSLASRRIEALIMREALTNLGLKPVRLMSDHSKLEGGDVIPVTIDGVHTVIVGLGSRTKLAAAEELQRILVPTYADAVIALEHDRQLLHLDTSFNILSAQTAVCAARSIRTAFRIERTGAIQITVQEFLSSAGIELVDVDKMEALEHEECNILPIGDGQIVSFTLPKELRQRLTNESLGILEIKAQELPKAAGGVHCLTRPIY